LVVNLAICILAGFTTSLSGMAVVNLVQNPKAYSETDSIGNLSPSSKV
jgi:hypothetical protein